MPDKMCKEAEEELMKLLHWMATLTADPNGVDNRSAYRWKRLIPAKSVHSSMAMYECVLLKALNWESMLIFLPNNGECSGFPSDWFALHA